MKIRNIGSFHWWAHGQDLKREDGYALLNRRGWLHLYRGNPDTSGRKVGEVNYQLVIGSKRHTGTAMLTVGDGDGNDGVMLSLGFPGIRLYVGVEGILPDRWRPRVPGKKYPEEHELGFSIHDGCIWWKLWSVDGWDSRADWRNPESRIRQPVWHVTDWILGKSKHAKRVLESGVAAVITHEHVTYPLRIEFTEHTYSRPRWFGRQILYRANIEMSKPIPVPASEGIYELTGDPDDAIYSLSTNARTVDDALAALRVSLERNR